MSGSRDPADLDPSLQQLAQQFLEQCAAAGIEALLTVTYRSAEEQDVEYAKGRTEPGPRTTNAQGGQSPHNCVLPDGTPAALAFDFALFADDGKRLDWDGDDQRWQTAIKIGEGLGLISGATFPGHLCDRDHLELKGWNSPEQTPQNT
jgi:peptidoglycan L-alanyl-D-glutamate endopeptidase CwlK